MFYIRLQVEIVYFTSRAENEVLPTRDSVSSSRRSREHETIELQNPFGRGVNTFFTTLQNKINMK
jgi:hypothetical protein